MSTSAPKAEYQKRTTGADETQLNMVRRLEPGAADHWKLGVIAESGDEFMSTPFDSTSLRLLVNELNGDTIKIVSGEITNAPFLLEIGELARGSFCRPG